MDLDASLELTWSIALLPIICLGAAAGPVRWDTLQAQQQVEYMGIDLQ